MNWLRIVVVRFVVNDVEHVGSNTREVDNKMEPED
jgi:hypothetical protein